MFHAISSSELRKINKAIRVGLKEIEVSLDLGISKNKIRLDKDGFFIGNKKIKIKRVREDDKCVYITNNGLEKVQCFSKDTNLMYKLVPTNEKPILKISGTSMHKKSFVEKIKNDKLVGKVLDAGTGLGYTTIAAAKTANEIVTVEKDKFVTEIAKLNPYSQELFLSSKIKLIRGDLCQVIKTFRANIFDFIIFDAGALKSSGEFFSSDNHKQAFRVLKKSVSCIIICQNITSNGEETSALK